MTGKPLTLKFATLAATLTAVILVLMPFHAFLTVWLNSLIGHYTLLRLWKETLLLVLVGIAMYLLWRDKAARTKFIASRLNQLIVAFIAVITLWGVVAYLTHHVTPKALGYGLIVDTRFLFFFLAVSVFARYSPRLKELWPKLVLWPAMIVVLLGLIQYAMLPYDFLRHFGYTDTTIFPYETINHNIHYIRIMSTLRGANPLGAYLIVVISLLAAWWLKRKPRGAIIGGILATVALVLTFSRSAWIGLVLAMAMLLWASVRTHSSRKVALLGGVGVILIAAVAGLALHRNAAFQNAIYHTDDKSKIATTSNEGHASALKNGLRDVAHQPLGEGTGTAGPASVYNANKVRIAENYFVQIGQEVGWLGIALFVAINLYLGRELWHRRADPLALGLLAALVGLSFVNLLSHAWADDTLAYVFWGLAGIAVAQTTDKPKNKPRFKASAHA